MNEGDCATKRRTAPERAPSTEIAKCQSKIANCIPMRYQAHNYIIFLLFSATCRPGRCLRNVRRRVVFAAVQGKIRPIGTKLKTQRAAAIWPDITFSCVFVWLRLFCCKNGAICIPAKSDWPFCINAKTSSPLLCLAFDQQKKWRDHAVPPLRIRLSDKGL